jgi:hypothetical protein
MPEDTTAVEIITIIRDLAGVLGESNKLSSRQADAVEYEHQVKCGLATAVMDIITLSPWQLKYFVGLCAIRLGLGRPDQRIHALLDALERELEAQLEAIERAKKEAGASGAPEAPEI